MMLPLSLLLLSALLLLSVQADSTYYQLNATETYAWTSAFPQSCECMESNTPKASCTLFRCTCTCDVTAGVCDYGCCCDPDCTTAQTDRFAALDSCAPEGYAPQLVRLCYSSTELAKINPQTPLDGQPTATNAVDEALCVYKKNFIQKADYFKDYDTQPASVFNQPLGQKTYDFIEESSVTYLRDSYFDQNDTIAAFLDIGTNDLISHGSGYWQLPASDFTGLCNDQNNVLFEVDRPAASCIRALPTDSTTFQSLCNSEWSYDYFIKRLRLATSAATSPASTTKSTVAVTVTELVYQDFSTGQQTAMNLSMFEQWDCSTLVADNSTLQHLFGACTLRSPEFIRQYNGASQLFCLGAVKEVTYSVQHAASAQSSIESVKARIVITDLPLPTASASTTTTNANFAQSFAVAFSSNVSASQTQAAGNLVSRKRSGNPGYILGRPILFGEGHFNLSVSANPLYINEFEEGLTIPSPFTSVAASGSSVSSLGQALCPTYTSSGVAWQSVEYGYDLTSGCVLHLNRTQLESLCCQGASSCSSSSVGSSPYSSTSSGLPFFFNVSSGYVGIYGNADPLDSSQWIPLSVSVPSPNRVWNAQTGTCSNMFTGLHYQFLVARTGEKYNPQDKIIAATASVSTSNWIMSLPRFKSNTTQAFQLSITVSFITTDSSRTQSYTPPAPPVLFKVPYDVFYPFQANAAPRSAVRPASWAWAIVVGVATISLWLL